MENSSKKNNLYRVLLVHNFYRLGGGEHTVFENEKKLLETHGHHVVTYTRDNAEIGNTLWGKVSLPFQTVFSLRTYRDVRKIIRQERIDVVHVHNTLALISPSVFYAARREGVPVVQTLHNFRMLCPNAVFFRDGHICEDCLQKGLYCALRHRCYRNSFFQTACMAFTIWLHRKTGIWKDVNFICLTEFNKNKLLQLNRKRKRDAHRVISPARVFVKPNFTWPSEAEPLPYNRREGFLYVGRLEKIKGVDLLLKAWAKMEASEKRKGEVPPHLTLCGTGPLEDDLKKYAENKGLRSVTFLGQCTHEKVQQLMGTVRALLFPSIWYEGMPMTILEAFSVVTPVISTDTGNAAALVKETGAGTVFQIQRREALRKAIQRVTENQKMYCEKASTAFRMRYEAEKSHQALCEVYDVAMTA